MNRRRQPMSFQRVTLRLIAFGLLPVIILAILTGFNSVSTSNRIIAQSHQMQAQQWASWMDGELSTIRAFLNNLAFGDGAFAAMGMGGAEAYFSMIDLVEQMRVAVSAFPELSAMCFISNGDGLWADRFSEDISDYRVRNGIRGEAKARLAGKTGFEGTGWRALILDGESYLTYTVGRRGAYLLAVVRLEGILDTGNPLVRTVFFDSEAQRPLTDGDWIEQSGIELAPTEEYHVVGDDQRYMMVNASLSEAPVELFAFVSDEGYFSGTTSLQKLLLVLSLLSLSLVSWFQHNINTRIGQPLKRLRYAMKRVQEGHLDEIIADEFTTSEFCAVRDSFNDMAHQIEHLKIETYEQEISKRRIELQYLHLQIRPHFLLNCLKGIYASAQQNRTDRVQRQVLLVSRMMRYMFRDVNVTVPLRDELEYVRDYLEVQKLSLPVEPELRLEGDEALQSCPLPPFSVSTFVENAFKHRKDTSQPLHIAVKYLRLKGEDGEYLDVSVRNDGGAFPNDVLLGLNESHSEILEGNRIGLNNIYHRLTLLYGDRATLAFYNEENTAVAEMILPMDEEVPANHERADC